MSPRPNLGVIIGIIILVWAALIILVLGASALARIVMAVA